MDMFDIPIMVIKDAISEANLAGMETEEHACRAALAVLEAADKVDKDNAEEWLYDGMAQGREYYDMMAPYKGYDIKDYDRAVHDIGKLLASLPGQPADRLAGRGVSDPIKPIIVSDPQRKWGQPTFAGTRLTLTFIIELLQTRSVSEVIIDYPYMEEYRGLLTEIRDIVKTPQDAAAKKGSTP